jgi:hypothetical protein
MVAAVGRPRLASTCRAALSSVRPSGVVSLIEASGSSAAPFNRSSGRVRLSHASCTAASNSATRIRPSLSVSMSANVRASRFRPEVGHANATHSFWSSDAR